MRFLILGTGYIGPINTKALMACEGVEIAGVCNRTREKAENMCRDLGLSCPVYTDWKEALDIVKPDVAVINVFNDLHKEYFLECASRGINILVEKPLANVYEDCQEMIRAAKQYGIRASVLQTQRYGSVLTTGKNYIDGHREELGELCGIQDYLSCNYFWQGRNPWHLDDKRSGGGIVLNYGVHQLDRILWFLEDSTTQFHARYMKKKEGIDTLSSYVMMGVSTGGIPYTATCCGYSGPGIIEMTLNFTRATLRLVLDGGGLVAKGVYAGTTGSGQMTSVPLCCADGEGMHEMYVREMKEAVAYLSGETDTAPVPLEWSAEVVRLCCEGFQNS